ncbi:GNAT family N-acetyltransferase [Tomitella biformata]|uniref:GNAT family N-acetyltransferase n=1 Tax=Tomitella biformata TaxID=630403 RepID=UPI000466513B|nr:GNAT family N-acetyltransferase [Tomitella biformata]
MVGFTWNKESDPVWDADKRRVIGGAPAGAFDLNYKDGQGLPGEWWSVTDGGSVVGYGWLDNSWGDAEILLATDPDTQGKGVGSFTLDNLEREASSRGVNYVYNTIHAGHPNKAELHNWLDSHGFRGSAADESLRKRVGRDASEPPRGPSPTFDSAVDMAPGRESEGGYVDPEDQKY